MINKATTWVTILGGEGGENEWGDPVEGDTELATRVPCAIHVQPRQSTSDEGQREPVTILFYTAYVPNRTAVSGANRLRDERTGETYLIDTVIAPQHPSLPQDTRLDLRRVS